MWRLLLLSSLLWSQVTLTYQDTTRKVYIYTLPNGLTVIVSPNPATPRAFVMIATRAGSKNDPPTHTGLAHYLEHLLFKGTDRYGTKDYDREKPYLDAIEALYETYNQTRDSLARLRLYQQIDSVAQLAAEWAIPNEYDRMVSALGATGTNAFTSFEVTAYINDVPAHQVERLLRLEAERFRKPVLRLFHTELEAVYEEKNIAIDNEGRELNEKLLAALFPDHPYGTQTTIGTIEHLKNPSISAIKKYYETYYVPNNMAIIVAGAVEPQKVAEWAQKYFGDFPAKPIPKFPYPKGAPSPLKKRQYIEVVGPQPPQLVVGFRLPPAGTPEALKLQLLDQILSNSVTGLLDEWLVQTRKVKSAASSPMVLADHSAHFFYLEPKPGQSLEEAEKLFWEALRRIQKGDFDESLLQAAVNDLLFSRLKAWRDNRARAQILLDIFIKQLPWAEALHEIEALRTLRKADLVAFARKYYNPKACVVAYKKQGPRPPLPKVPKPPITPLKIERAQASSFTEAFLAEAASTALPQPQFVQFDQVLHARTLHGRIPLYLLPNRDDSLFTLLWYLPLGSEHDKWIPLILRYYELVGPKGLGVQAFKRRLFSLGGRIAFRSDNRQAYIQVEGLAQNLVPIAALVDSLLRTPEVDEKTWAFLRENTLKNRADAKQNPLSIQRFLIAYGLYGPENPSRYIPSEAELRQMTAEELARRAADLWRFPWELYYDGPVSEGLEKLLEKAISAPVSWEAPPAPKRFLLQETTPKTVLFVHFPMVRALMTWIHRSVPYQRELVPQARFFTEYFGGGMSAVVFQQIREAKGLAYAAGAYFVAPDQPDKPFYFIGNIGTQADKLVEAHAAMEALIDSLEIVPSLAEVARQALLSEIATTRPQHEEVFYSFWEARRFGLSRERRADLWEALQQLSPKDLEAFYHTYLQYKPRTLLLVGDRERLPLQALQQKGLAVRELSVEEVFGY